MAAAHTPYPILNHYELRHLPSHLLERSTSPRLPCTSRDGASCDPPQYPGPFDGRPFMEHRLSATWSDGVVGLSVASIDYDGLGNHYYDAIIYRCQIGQYHSI